MDAAWFLSTTPVIGCPKNSWLESHTLSPNVWILGRHLTPAGNSNLLIRRPASNSIGAPQLLSKIWHISYHLMIHFDVYWRWTDASRPEGFLWFRGRIFLEEMTSALVVVKESECRTRLVMPSSWVPDSVISLRRHFGRLNTVYDDSCKTPEIWFRVRWRLRFRLGVENPRPFTVAVFYRFNYT